jgi:hypothetical protein
MTASAFCARSQDTRLGLHRGAMFKEICLLGPWL